MSWTTAQIGGIAGQLGEGRLLVMVDTGDRAGICSAWPNRLSESGLMLGRADEGAAPYGSLRLSALPYDSRHGADDRSSQLSNPEAPPRIAGDAAPGGREFSGQAVAEDQT